MQPIPNPRGIIDRRVLSAALDAVGDRSEAARDRAVGDLLKAALDKGSAEIARRFETSRDPLSGRDAARAQAFLMDQLLRCVYDFAERRIFPTAGRSAGEQLAMLAVGGYGRGELAPFSDIDLLFISPYKFPPRSEQIVEYILYRLWDLGLKVGQAVRTLEDCVARARADMTIRTALLEARYIWGEQKLYNQLMHLFWTEVANEPGLDFVEAKLAERDQRHARHLDSRYAVEPQIKDGKGGLRDLHTLYWIAKYLYRVADVSELPAHQVLSPAEAARFDRAEAFLWRLRWHLHLTVGRAEEKLTFDLQPPIAARMHYGTRAHMRAAERLMKHYFVVAKSVGDLTRIFCAGIEAAHRKSAPARGGRSFVPISGMVDGFILDGGRLSFADPDQPLHAPVEMMRLFHVAQDQGYAIHPDSLRWITRHLHCVDRAFRRDPMANRLFMDILTTRKGPEPILRRLSECGLFGRFIPDFGRVVAQMQFDMYHHYTVDEHTLFAIGILHKIEDDAKNPHDFSGSVAARIQSRRALYVAVLLHDIAKGRGGDHSELGADVARKLGPRLGLSDEETETASWLVQHHLLMSNTAFRRDLDDPQTIGDFATIIQSVERLRLLYVLTVADIRAVGPGTWNGWKDSLLKRLYTLTEAQLTGLDGRRDQAARLEAARTAIVAAAQSVPSGPSADDIVRFLERCPPDYCLTTPVPTALADAALAKSFVEDAPFAAWTRDDFERGVTVMSIYAPDQPGLMARITAAFAASAIEIVAAQITTLSDGFALDRFALQDASGEALPDPSRIARLHSVLKRFLSAPLPGHVVPDRNRSARAAAFDVAARVLIDNSASATYTVIEVNGADRPGILHRVTAALAQNDLRIASAKINTFGARIVDVFYVKDRYGLKVDNDARIKQIRDGLMAVLEDRPGDAKLPPMIRDSAA